MAVGNGGRRALRPGLHPGGQPRPARLTALPGPATRPAPPGEHGPGSARRPGARRELWSLPTTRWASVSPADRTTSSSARSAWSISSTCSEP
jgi:hypothetical protein